MTTLTLNRKIELVQNWGFEHHIDGNYVRNIYAEEGYSEHWSEDQPDVIQFFRDGAHSHDYRISWSLFN
jgi:hypothetical protein